MYVSVSGHERCMVLHAAAAVRVLQVVVGISWDVVMAGLYVCCAMVWSGRKLLCCGCVRMLR